MIDIENVANWSILSEAFCIFNVAMSDLQTPHWRMRPKLSVDGNMWCALYGKNLQDGVAGFGESPDLAMRDFDNNWYKKLDCQGGE